MKNLFTLILCLVSANVLLYSYESRNLLQTKITPEELKSVLQTHKEWVPYPSYKDRKGWDKLTNGIKYDLISKGEEYLDYDWKVVKFTDYTEFEKSGSRVIMQRPFGQNNSAMAALVMAELAEGKGRFIDQIINGTWFACEMTTWVLSAHLPSFQSNGRSVPDPYEYTIDLTAGDLGSFYSWVYYFFKDEFDKSSPLIAKRLRHNIEDRILTPYMERSDFWWQALDGREGRMVNNWNPWCNFNVLTCFLLMEEDPDRLANAVYRSMRSVDEFINYTHEDGACEEGPSYWGHAAGKMFDYLDILSMATSGKVEIYDQPIIHNMGEYIGRSYVGDGWVVNFADASARGGGDKYVIYRYGKSVGSDEMKHFAAYLFHRDQMDKSIPSGRDIFRSLEALLVQPELKETKPELPRFQYTWYPQTEFCYFKTESGFYFAAKGGYNGESHNHNDVGTFSLYLDNIPFFIDAGVGTYTRQTFSSERYSIWTMQSNYHNLPVINGYAQKEGSEFKATGVDFDPGNPSFSLNLAKAYKPEAGIKEWKRSYSVNDKDEIEIRDKFELNNPEINNEINFMTWSKPIIAHPGVIELRKDGKSVQLSYNDKIFEVRSEAIFIDDERLSRVWGERIYRLTLKAKTLSTNGKYFFKISKLD
ncbi:heparinase II/III domain-containing protein [Membranihabitans maritimus]|uniref:heparinase II/III domain-containing protein n=1 Tax=Membranihabitans maritimus TaxID=2904244 RepID=UPI001F17320C|nr:heparinase II/III family protein [Membranihabitans maritimus]